MYPQIILPLPFPVQRPFIFLSPLTALARTPSTRLGRSGGHGVRIFFLILEEELLFLSPKSGAHGGLFVSHGGNSIAQMCVCHVCC